MEIYKKLSPIEAAQQFITKHYPNCEGALLAGSVVRGEATDTSDLDIVIFDRKIDTAYRESLLEFEWAIEVFVHNLSSYKQYFESDRVRARPSLPKMVFEGVILKDDGILEVIKKEAQVILQNGPEKWSDETIRIKRYFITDALDDFKGCTNRAEEIFIANALAELVSEFVLRTNQKWIGTSKWVVRALKQYDETFAKQFVDIFACYYRTGHKEAVIQLVEAALQPFGGPLFHGFSLGREKNSL
jgi:predicted nucleotidyltransferase